MILDIPFDNLDETFYSFFENHNSRLYSNALFLERLFNDNYYGIAVFTSPDLILLERNEKYAEQFGEPFDKKDTCIGRSIKQLIPDFEGSKSEKLIKNITLTGETLYLQEFEGSVKNMNGRYWDNSLTPISVDGEVKYIVSMLTDVTTKTQTKKHLEEQSKIIEALENAIEMKDEFLSLVSHEFRTPLNVINTAIQAIELICKDELSDRLKNYLRPIKQNCFRQQRLVNNLLDITRADAGRIKIYKKNINIVFLTKAITESVQTYSSQKGVTISFVSSIDKKVIGIDDEKYERILLNLLSNAIKFTPEGKCITVSLYSNKGRICIDVRDEGIGIPKDKADIIFERFGQVDSSLSRQAEGTGIGLSLVKRFVEALGGSISLKSRINYGSTFTISLPDEKAVEEPIKGKIVDLMDNRLIQAATIEFSDIYF
ncbi:MAG: ATP-binding protein [Bacillota bacterium]|nr:ATP-binding protein [Bacillota bacterium]